MWIQALLDIFLVVIMKGYQVFLKMWSDILLKMDYIDFLQR